MSDEIKTEQYSLSRDKEQVRNVKFYFRHGSKASTLDDYRKRAWAQIRAGVSQENTLLDRDLID